MRKILTDPVWREVAWQRPFEPESVQDLLTHLASVTPRSPVVWEVRGCKDGVRYLLCADRQYMKKLQAVFTAHGNIQFTNVEESSRLPINTAKRLQITHPILPLKTDTTLAVVRAGLSAMKQVKSREEIVLQILMGPSYSPLPMPQRLPDPHASWIKVAFGNTGPASAESRHAVREKTECHGFYVTVRLGAAGSDSTAPTHILNLLSALRTAESAGVSIHTHYDKPKSMDKALVPPRFPLRLSVKELAVFMLLPVGDSELPGVAGLHPRLLLPPVWYKNPERRNDRTFAQGVGPASEIRLSISPQDSLEHTIVLGPTGAGKSTVLENKILSDINLNHSVLLIDPKYELVDNILARVPESRINEVVVIDPSDAAPVGFNPLALTKNYDPALVTDAVLAVLKENFKENWGIRTKDVLTAALLTLTQVEGSSLLWLYPLLTDEAFRRKITARLTDRIGLIPFWESFENMKDSERRQEIAPVLNKLRQFLLRPGLRNVLGQSDPKFSLSDLFKKPRIVLVPLNKGMIGAEQAQLLGSLIVGLTWTLALSRAAEDPKKRRQVCVFIDELQDYISLPTDLSDALAQARGLGVSLTLAHQYRKQLPDEIRSGIDANARNKIIFTLNSEDAKAMAGMAPELESQDFMLLPRYRIYTSFQQNGKNTGWIQGQTLPPPTALRDPVDLRALSMKTYGKFGAEVEEEYLTMLQNVPGDKQLIDENDDPGTFRRRKRS